MVRVGIIGLGMMGLTHLDVYRRRSDCRVVALSDRDADRLAGRSKASGNVEGQAQSGVAGLDVKRYAEGNDLIADAGVDLVDICLPTHLHVDYAVAALKAGKHVLVEKPLARSAADGRRIADAARGARGLAMVAMCMRFWPGWTWLKEAVDDRRYGKVLAATFRRTASHPGGAFYSNGALSGGALLDLHIHDADFVQHLFGMPRAVTSAGYRKLTSEWDHVVTRYHFADGPLVVAEGGWAMTKGYPFAMEYTVNFERATASFRGGPQPLTVYVEGQPPLSPELPEGMGYDHEIDYFLDCIRRGAAPSRVTLEDGWNTLRLCEAESLSAQTGQTVTL